MKRRKINLTESTLRKIVAESVKKVLKEAGYADTTIPEDIRREFHYARSVYHNAFEYFQTFHSIHGHYRAALQEQLFVIDDLMRKLRWSKREIPENLLSLKKNMESLLNNAK
jgi:hypothetical protein